MADLEGHAALCSQASLKGEHDPAAVIPQAPGLVQFRADAGGNEPAVPGLGGQVRAEARLQAGLQGGQVVPPVEVESLEGFCQGDGKWRIEGAAILAKQVVEAGAAGQAVVQAAQVPRPPSAQGQTGQRPRHVPHALEPFPDLAAQVAPGPESVHGVQPTVDPVRIQERPGQTARQETGTGCRDCPVDRRQQGALASAGQAALDLQAGPGGGIDGHDVGLAGPSGRPERRRPAGLSGLEVGCDQAQGRDFRSGQGAEPVQGLDPVEPLQPGLRRARLGEGRRHGLDEAPGRLQGGADRLVGEQPVRREDLRRAQGGEG